MSEYERERLHGNKLLCGKCGCDFKEKNKLDYFLPIEGGVVQLLNAYTTCKVCSGFVLLNFYSN